VQLGVSAHIAAVVPFILGAGEVGTGSMVCDVLWLLFGGYKMVPKQCGSYPLPTVADYLFIDFLQSVIKELNYIFLPQCWTIIT